MDSTNLNTYALNTNTIVISIGIIVTIILAIFGYKKYRKKNIIKNTTNKRGNINQIGGNNNVDNVDNSEGNINQK